jgi:chromate reductase, NAD(P)H dehydrogenase (quinone)
MKIGIVIGSTRPGRLGERVCNFVVKSAAAVEGASFEVFDLAGYNMPFFDEPIAPWGNRSRTPAPSVARWLSDVASADGYVFLTPEYNFAAPAALKNALDFLAHEAEGKPASIISYADTPFGGIVAGHQLQLTLNKLGMLVMPMSLPLIRADLMLNCDGDTIEASGIAAKIVRHLPRNLRELVRYAAAIRKVRLEPTGPNGVT